MSIVTPEPLVSVVVPSYNGAKFLGESLKSIVEQTYRTIEILLLDDASTDETPAIARSFGNSIKYHRQPANRGQFRNVNDGISLATGKYIAVYHADDVYDHDIVAREVAFLEARPEVGIVFCLSRLVDGAGREYARLALPRSIRGARTLDYSAVLNGVLAHKNVFMPTPGAMARAELYRQIGPYTTEFGSAADLEMWLRFARRGQVGLLDRHLFNYRHVGSSEGQSYQAGRTVPENFFAVMEHEIAEFGSPHVLPAARRAFEAHRAVDTLRICVNEYIAGNLTAARAAWRTVSVVRLVASGKIRRPRHLALWLALGVLCRIRRFPKLASALHWRYYQRLPWWEGS